MNPDFLRIITATPEERRDLFLTTANRLGTPLQNVEKDFWVTCVLDLLFNGRQPEEPRLLFKGGTSLSKAYGLISRFSEDIDITVFREDLGQDIEVNDLEGLSGKQQRLRLEKIKQACQLYIQETLSDRLNHQIRSLLSIEKDIVVNDPGDRDGQTLLVHYPITRPDETGYIKPAVKIEAGAKSALDPHRTVMVQPYVAQDLTTANLAVNGIVTIDAERTFWDKVIILHGLRRWHDKRGTLRQQGHRVSRHYYDIYQLMQSTVGQKAISNQTLGEDCKRHALMFFNSTDLDLRSAQPGTFSLIPTSSMIDELKRDYQSMTTMIFGEVPEFSMVLETIEKLESQLNQS